MKIENRTKGILIFNFETGHVVLEIGFNELSKSDSDLVQTHPMFSDYVKTSQLRFVSESEKISEEKEEINIEDIELEKQSKDQLIVLALALEIKVDGLTKKQLIEAIEKSKK
jgi:hypothetical protein